MLGDGFASDWRDSQVGAIGIIGAMTFCALLPFALLVKLVRGGHAGWSISLLSVLGACLMILMFATGRPFGINPAFAMTAALLVFLPALLGGSAGALLGWLLRRRDDRMI